MRRGIGLARGSCFLSAMSHTEHRTGFAGWERAKRSGVRKEFSLVSAHGLTKREAVPMRRRALAERAEIRSRPACARFALPSPREPQPGDAQSRWRATLESFGSAGCARATSNGTAEVGSLASRGSERVICWNAAVRAKTMASGFSWRGGRR